MGVLSDSFSTIARDHPAPKLTELTGQDKAGGLRHISGGYPHSPGCVGSVLLEQDPTECSGHLHGTATVLSPHRHHRDDLQRLLLYPIIALENAKPIHRTCLYCTWPQYLKFEAKPLPYI